MTRRVIRTVRFDPEATKHLEQYVVVSVGSGSRGLLTAELPRHPRLPYRVTYTRSPRGQWEIYGHGLVETTRTWRPLYPVCFLPADWPPGTRMTRRTEALPRRRKKASGHES